MDCMIWYGGGHLEAEGQTRMHWSPSGKNVRLVFISWQSQTWWVIPLISWIELWAIWNSNLSQNQKKREKKKKRKRRETEIQWNYTTLLQHSPLCFNTEVCPWACCQQMVPWQRSTGNTKLINPHEASFSNTLEEWLYYSKKNWKVLDMSSNWLCTVTVLHTPTCCK